MSRSMALAVIVAVLGLSCGGGSLKRSGDQCAASSECGAGLICDLNRTPPVCSGTGILDAFIEPDASKVHLDAGEDAAGAIDAHVPLPDAHVIDAAVMIDAPVMVDAPVTVDAAFDAPVMDDAPTD